MGWMNNGGARGGFHVTWIVAVGIALFGLFRYLTHTQVNPVTGESQRLALSPQQEVAMGLQAAPQMAGQMGGEIPESDPRARLVEAMGQRLVAKIDAKDMPWKFDFHLLRDEKTINAFALPGGQVFITEALMEKLQNEAQLAGVLGHEIGHVIHRHSAQHMAKGELGQSLVTAVAVGASDDDRGRGQMAAYAAQMANQMLQLKYGRDDESQSDAFGVRLMARAGYAPDQMVEVMRILKEASGGRSGPQFLSTHPDPGNRAEAIQEQLKQEYPNGLPPGLTKGAPLGGAMPPPLPAPAGRGAAGRSAGGGSDEKW